MRRREVRTFQAVQHADQAVVIVESDRFAAQNAVGHVFEDRAALQFGKENLQMRERDAEPRVERPVLLFHELLRTGRFESYNFV